MRTMVQSQRFDCFCSEKNVQIIFAFLFYLITHVQTIKLKNANLCVSLNLRKKLNKKNNRYINIQSKEIRCPMTDKIEDEIEIEGEVVAVKKADPPSDLMPIQIRDH